MISFVICTLVVIVVGIFAILYHVKSEHIVAKYGEAIWRSDGGRSGGTRVLSDGGTDVMLNTILDSPDKENMIETVKDDGEMVLIRVYNHDFAPEDESWPMAEDYRYAAGMNLAGIIILSDDRNSDVVCVLRPRNGWKEAAKTRIGAIMRSFLHCDFIRIGLDTINDFCNPIANAAESEEGD